MPDKLFKIEKKEYLLPGNRACQGCSLALAYRYVLKALGKNVIYTLPASCLTVVYGLYPISSVDASLINCTFPSCAASASGIVAALKALKRDKDTNVVAIAGDGGTFDIGMQALSGALERQTNFIFICYNNEGYMNTGTQRSSATPLGAITSTTPFLTKLEPQKDIIKIVEAHNVSYVASSSPAYPKDLYDKLVKAKGIKGSKFMHILTPCPPGWGFPINHSVKIAKLSVDCGVSVLFEIEDGKFQFTGRSKFLAEKNKKKDVTEYIKAQKRFDKISDSQIEDFQKWVDMRWKNYLHRNNAS